MTRLAGKIIIFCLVLCFATGLFGQERTLSAQNLPPSTKGILGGISAQPEFAFLKEQEEVLLVPTEAGLYIIKDGLIKKHLCPGQEISGFGILPDLDQDGHKDLVISIKEELLPNVLALSSGKEEVIWRFSPVNKIYKEGFGWFDYQPVISGIITLGDSKEQFIYLTAGDSLFKISAFTGQVVWEHREEGSIAKVLVAEGINSSKSRDIILLNQRGEAVFINGDSGAEVERQIGAQFPAQDTNQRITDSHGRILRTDLPSEVVLLDRGQVARIWSVPIFSSNGYVGLDEESSEFLLLYAVVQETEAATKQGLLQKVTGHGEIIWEYLLESSLLADYEGISKIQSAGDLNQDGFNDILGALSPVETAGSLPAKIIAIDGQAGQTLWEGNLIHHTKVTSVIPYQDINNDGSPEVLIGTSTHFYVLNGADGKIIRDWTHHNLQKNGYFEPTKGMGQEVLLIPSGDVNKDDLTDLFVVSPRQVRLALSNRVGGLDFYFKDLYSVSQGDLSLQEAHSLTDLNGDGIPELLVTKEVGGQIIKTILSGADGKLMAEMAGSNLIFKPTGVDFNNNQVLDLLCYQADAAGKLTLRLIDGLNGKSLWAYAGFNAPSGFSFNEISPGCLVDDLNRDGIPELAVLKYATSGTGLCIEIFDAAGGWEEPYKTLHIQDEPYLKLNRHWAPGLTLRMISHNTQKYLALTGRLGGRDEGLKLVLYDFQQEKTVAIYPIAARDLTLKADFFIAEDLKGKVSFWNFPFEEPVAEIRGESALSPLELEWTKADPFTWTKIYIDNVLALETQAETAELAITPGKHLLGIAQYNQRGEHSYQSFPIEVAGNKKAGIITVILTIVSLSLVFAVPGYVKARIRAGVKRG